MRIASATVGDGLVAWHRKVNRIRHTLRCDGDQHSGSGVEDGLAADGSDINCDSDGDNMWPSLSTCIKPTLAECKAILHHDFHWLRLLFGTWVEAATASAGTVDDIAKDQVQVSGINLWSTLRSIRRTRLRSQMMTPVA